MTNTLERRRFSALLGRMKETLAAPILVNYVLLNQETLLEIEENNSRGLLRLYFSGQEMSVKEFSASALEQALIARQPVMRVRIARHVMRSAGGLRWFIDRVMDMKTDLCVVWTDVALGQVVPEQRPSWVGEEITDDARFTPMGLVIQVCNDRGIVIP